MKEDTRNLIKGFRNNDRLLEKYSFSRSDLRKLLLYDKKTFGRKHVARVTINDSQFEVAE